MSQAVVLSRADWAVRSAVAFDGDYSALDMTGANGLTNYTNFGTFLTRYTSGDVVRLPYGTLVIDGNASGARQITFPAGVRFIGHEQGTTLQFRNPGGSHNPFLPSSNCEFENLVFQWAMDSHPTAGADCSLVYGVGLDNVRFRRCKFFGDADTTGAVAVGSQLYWRGKVMPLDLRNCTNILLDECEIARSTGTNYGLQVIGGSNHLYRDCYWHHNAADGVKMFGNSAYGQPSSMRFLQCRSDYNGQIIIQGQTVYTATYSANATITPVSGARYLVNGTFNLTLNNGSAGDTFLVAKLIGSGTCTLMRADGTTPVLSLTTAYDRLVCQFSWNSGSSVWELTTSAITNGEGWDITGNDITLSDCHAIGNESTGIQIKPTLIGAAGKNVSSGIRLSACTARDSWTGNGIGIVNNITSGEVSPQDISLTDCLAESNYASGIILSSGALPIYGVSLNNCSARNNGNDGLSITAFARFLAVRGCKFIGNGTRGSGWNVKLYAAKWVRFSDCFFSGVDPYSQLLLTEADVNNTVNARCYGVLIDKASGGTMSDVVFDWCRWHNHLATNGASTDIRFYDGGLSPVLTTGYNQSVSGSPAQLVLGSVCTGILKINTQQTATLTHSSATAYSGGATYSLTDSNNGGNPSVVISGGNMYRYINASPSSGNAPPNVTYWVQVGSDIVSLA